MAGTFIVELQHVRFVAAHGLYKEEALVGNEFEIDVSISFKAPKIEVISIEHTVDYVKVYQLINDVMQEQHGLLETCAQNILEGIHQQFDFIRNASITIRKVNAPITNFTGSVSVTFSKRFK